MQYDIIKCTRCGQSFKDLRIKTVLSIQTDRLTDTGLWEEIPNLYQISQDYLCKDCFDSFANILEKMNEPQSEQEKIRMDQKKENVLDGIEYSKDPESDEEIQPVTEPVVNPVDLVEVEPDCKYATN